MSQPASKILQELEGPFDCFVHNEQALIWDANVAYTLRKKHRIVGTAIGTLGGFPTQNQYLSVPLMLLPEEVTLGLKKGFLKLRSGSKIMESLSEEEKAAIDAHHDREVALQVRYLQTKKPNKRDREVEDRASARMELFEGLAKKRKEKEEKEKEKEEDLDEEALKRRALLAEMEKKRAEIKRVESEKKDTMKRMKFESMIESSLYRVVPTTADDVIEAKYKRGDADSDVDVEWNFPKTEEEKNRSLIYQDVWERGFYLTSASKFGGEFLAYPGDPVRFHSQFCVIVVPYGMGMSPHDLVSYGRLGVSVKKTPLLSSIHPDTGKPVYMSIEWCGGL